MFTQGPHHGGQCNLFHLLLWQGGEQGGSAKLLLLQEESLIHGPHVLTLGGPNVLSAFRGSPWVCLEIG